jgi:hypothetical protein
MSTGDVLTIFSELRSSDSTLVTLVCASPAATGSLVVDSAATTEFFRQGARLGGSAEIYQHARTVSASATWDVAFESNRRLATGGWRPM